MAIHLVQYAAHIGKATIRQQNNRSKTINLSTINTKQNQQNIYTSSQHLFLILRHPNSLFGCIFRVFENGRVWNSLQLMLTLTAASATLSCQHIFHSFSAK